MTVDSWTKPHTSGNAAIAAEIPAPGGAKERRRGMAWSLIWVAIAIAAIYFLIPEIGGLQASLPLLKEADAGWLAAGAALVALRYTMVALSLQAAVGRSLPPGTALLVQLSSGFVGRLTPEGVGWVVLNQRFLEQLGLDRPTALAGITLKVVAGIVTRLAITGMIGVSVGTSGMFQSEVPALWPYLLALAFGTVLMGALVRSVFRPAASRAMALIVTGFQSIASIFHQPLRVAVLFGSSAAATFSYGLALAASVMAVGADVSLLQVLAIYLGGTAIAAASPTPGNIGAVEVALSAGLTAVGVPSTTAVAAVLIYRLLKFWLPLAPGFIAFRYLQQRRHI